MSTNSQIAFTPLGKTVVVAAAGTAQAASVAPVAGTPSDAIVLVPGAVEILRFNKDTFFSGLAAAATTVYITPGQCL